MAAMATLASIAGIQWDRARVHHLRGRASLAVGQHLEAVEALRTARRGCWGQEAGLVDLQEVDALFGLGRHVDALAVATRALRRRCLDADLEARLRVARGQALWSLGRVAPGRREVRAGLGGAAAELTRARAYEALAVFAWKDQDLEGAAEQLALAREIYLRAGSREGLVRTLERQAALLRDTGRLDEALRIQTLRVEVAATTTRRDAVACARNDRGALFVLLGRWSEAREELARSAELFRRVSDPREFTLAGVQRSALDLAEGDLIGARTALAKAREMAPAERADPRALAEALLCLSDVELAAGTAPAAEDSLAQALGLFALVRDPVGECRARYRRSHVLLALGRAQEAAREARRALRIARWPTRSDLRAWSELALGRALLRMRRPEARAAFGRALALSHARPVVARMARLGQALAQPAGPGQEVRAALEAIEAWGERRLLAYCLADLRDLAGERPARGSRDAEAATSAPAPGATGRSVVESDCPREDPASEGPPPQFRGIVGRSPGMEDLFRKMGRLGSTDVPIHIFGETGTGKERVARALHQVSPRAGRPFVALNASALSDELFEAELFGHVRGAFSGAVADRSGLIAEAEGGTLFLDEVTDLSPKAQAKLLRLLQEKEYRRVGENRIWRADVRVITAANVPLERRVAAGLFREDLMYRMTALVLTLPPLRERGDDLLRLARHFLRQAAERAGRPTPALPRDLAAALIRHAWPGNVRELENEMTRVFVLAGDGPLGSSQLSPRVLAGQHAAPAPLRDAVISFERAHVARMLELHDGNRSRTACALGLTRQGLVAKIRRLGIS